MDTDFLGGGLSISQMEDAIVNSKRVVAVLTPNFVQSDWTKLETAMARTLDPGARRRKLVPILLEDGFVE